MSTNYQLTVKFILSIFYLYFLQMEAVLEFDYKFMKTSLFRLL